MSRTAAEIKNIIAQEASRVLGVGNIEVTRLGGDASNRIYHRCKGVEGSLVIMELGQSPLKSEEVSSTARSKELPFLDVQRFLARGGLAVPHVYYYWEEQGLLLLEDLGDRTFESLVLPAESAEKMVLYQEAIDELIRIQTYTFQHSSGCECFGRRFDFELLRWELDHFREWILEKHRCCVLTPAETQQMERSFDEIAQRLSELPAVWVHRDYQSRNLMVQSHAGGIKLRVIDFQDALMGPPPYDLVALLRDSYVKLGVDHVQSLMEYYLEHGKTPLDRATFREMFWLQTVQRKLKDAGRFVFIDRVKHNPSFLKHIPNSLIYVSEALEYLPQLEGLKSILVHHVEEFS